MLAMSKKDQTITNYKKMSIEQLEKKLKSSNVDEMKVLLDEISLRHRKAINWCLALLLVILLSAPTLVFT